MSRIEIEFYTRPGCHLCDEAFQLLEELQGEFNFEIRVIDISSSPRLEALYGHDIPVATLAGRKILKHRGDPALLRRVLAERSPG